MFTFFIFRDDFFDNIVSTRKKEHELISLQSKLAYPIKRDIPLMHIDFARKITNKEISILLKES